MGVTSQFKVHVHENKYSEVKCSDITYDISPKTNKGRFFKIWSPACNVISTIDMSIGLWTINEFLKNFVQSSIAK